MPQRHMHNMTNNIVTINESNEIIHKDSKYGTIKRTFSINGYTVLVGPSNAHGPGSIYITRTDNLRSGRLPPNDGTIKDLSHLAPWIDKQGGIHDKLFYSQEIPKGTSLREARCTEESISHTSDIYNKFDSGGFYLFTTNSGSIYVTTQMLGGGPTIVRRRAEPAAATIVSTTHSRETGKIRFVAGSVEITGSRQIKHVLSDGRDNTSAQIFSALEFNHRGVAYCAYLTRSGSVYLIKQSNIKGNPTTGDERSLADSTIRNYVRINPTTDRVNVNYKSGGFTTSEFIIDHMNLESELGVNIYITQKGKSVRIFGPLERGRYITSVPKSSKPQGPGAASGGPRVQTTGADGATILDVREIPKENKGRLVGKRYTLQK
jgi:hypothetical protein